MGQRHVHPWGHRSERNSDSVSRVETVRRALSDNIDTILPHLIAAMTTLGALESWRSDTVEDVAEALDRIAAAAGLPTSYSSQQEPLEHWRLLAEELSIYHDGQRNPACTCEQWKYNADDGEHPHRGDDEGCTALGCACERQGNDNREYLS